MEYRWGRDGLVSRDGVKNALGYGLAGADAASGMQELSYNASGGGGGGGSGEVTLAKPSGKDIVKKVTEGVKQAIKLDKFGDKAYKAARDQDYSHDEAMDIAREAQAYYTAYKAGSFGADLYLLKKFWPAYFVKGPAEEAYEDDIHDYIIRSTVEKYKLAKNPPEGWIPPP